MYNFLASNLHWADIHFSIILTDIKGQLSAMSNSFTLIGHNIQDIRNHLTLSKPLWKTLLDHPLVCVFAGVLLALVPQRYKEHKRKISKLKAARASFENTRLTLLMFKGQFLIPYRKEMSKILCAYIKKTNKLSLPKPTKVKDFNLDNNNVIEQIFPEWQKLNTPFEFRNELNFYHKSWAEELSFVSAHTPDYLVTFHISYERLIELNQLLANRNSIIKQYREKSLYEGNLNCQHVIDAIHLHWDFAKNLKEHIDTALDFNRRCEDHLKAYEKRYFPLTTLFGFKSLFNFRIKTPYDSLMPREDYLAGYDSQIQNIKNKQNLRGFL